MGVNRQKRMDPKQGKTWCRGCDRILIHTDGTKCPICGYRNGIRRFKKSILLEINKVDLKDD